MYITIEELKTHLYKEYIDVISQDDDTIITAAIDAAVAEAKGYLGNYDREQIFVQQGARRNPLLLVFIKDIAVWHFATLSNAGINYDKRAHRYERAIDWLKSVQNGRVTPDLPVIKDNKGHTAGVVKFGSNPKRNQHF